MREQIMKIMAYVVYYGGNAVCRAINAIACTDLYIEIY